MTILTKKILLLLLVFSPLFCLGQEYMVKENGDTIPTSILKINKKGIIHVPADDGELKATVSAFDDIKLISHQDKGILAKHELYSRSYLSFNGGFSIPVGDYANSDYTRTSGLATGGKYFVLNGAYFIGRTWGVIGQLGYFDNGFDVSQIRLNLSVNPSPSEEIQFNVKGNWTSSFLSIGVIKGFPVTKNFGFNVGALLRPFKLKKPSFRYEYTNASDTTKFILTSSSKEGGNGGISGVITNQIYFNIVDRVSVGFFMDIMIGSAKVDFEDSVRHEFPSFTDGYTEHNTRYQDVATVSFGANITYYFNRAPYFRRRKNEK